MRISRKRLALFRDWYRIGRDGARIALFSADGRPTPSGFLTIMLVAPRGRLESHAYWAGTNRLIRDMAVIRDTTLDAALAKFYATFLKLHVTITSITDEENTQ